MLRRRMAAVAGGRLPAAYQEVEWIGCSAGGPYINTGLYPTSEWKITGNFRMEAAPAYTAYIFGVKQGSNKVLEFYGNSNNLAYKNTSSGASVLNCGSTDTSWHSFEAAEKTMKIDSTTYTSSSFGGITSITNPLLLLGTFQASGAITGGNTGREIKEIFIENENGVLVGDFVPCYRKSDNAIGMYDLVTNAFLGNSGSGSFTKGSNV